MRRPVVSARDDYRTRTAMERSAVMNYSRSAEFPREVYVGFGLGTDVDPWAFIAVARPARSAPLTIRKFPPASIVVVHLY